jgi:UDP-N-acetylmuramyl tripeptide synthase
MALQARQAGSVVAITGKGTDPYIMGPRGSREPWSDKRVAEEELDKLLQKN